MLMLHKSDQAAIASQSMTEIHLNLFRLLLMYIFPSVKNSRPFLSIKATAADNIPHSFEASVSQAAQAVRTSLFGSKLGKGKRSKSLRRLSVEVPNLNTDIGTRIFITSELVEAIESDGKREACVIYFDQEIVRVAEGKFPKNPVCYIDEALNRQIQLGQRLLVFDPPPEDETKVFSLLDDVWRGEAVVLFNSEFSDDFKEKQKSFVDAFDVVYCFMPLAIKVLFQQREGALFRWKRGTGSDDKWKLFLDEKGEFKQIGQSSTRPTESQLESAIYNATAAQSPIVKGVSFLRSLGKSN